MKSGILCCEFLAEEKFLKIQQVSITDFGWNDNENIHISACTNWNLNTDTDLRADSVTRPKHLIMQTDASRVRENANKT